jgi:hypothetical protein
VPLLHTPHGAIVPLPHGWQQSAVAEQPAVKSGTQSGFSQWPLASGSDWRQTSPGAHTGAASSRLPPHGPPGPETQRHSLPALAVSQLAPDGHAPPHVPAAVLPQGRTQRADGPAQQPSPPAAFRHTQVCWQAPSTQRSAVHGLASAQSALLVHCGAGVVRGPGRHWQLPAASRSQWPSSTSCGHAPPLGQSGAIVQAPPHGTLLQAGGGTWGVGGTHWQAPSASTSQCPSQWAETPPAQAAPGGQAGDSSTTHGPPQAALSQEGSGVGVGRGVSG